MATGSSCSAIYALWDAEDIEREENEFLGLTDDDIGEPSGHWRSQIEILPNGDGILNTDDNLDIEEHPECQYTSEQEWGKWAVGDREGRDDDQYKFSN